MTERSLNRILIAVGTLVVIYLGATLLRGDSGGSDPGNGPAALLEAVTPERVEAVRFVEAGDTVRLERGDRGWTVNGLRADSATVEGFWSELTDARSGGPVARNPENHRRLGVTEDDAAHVVFRLEDGEERELLVGSSGPTYPSAYVRLPDEDVVHLLHGQVRGAVTRDPDGWRDRRIARVDTSRVDRIEVRAPAGSYALERSEAGWSVDGAPADSAAAQRLVGGLASLRASGFAPDTVRLPEPSHRVVALESSGDTLLSLAMEREEGAYRARARAAGDSTIYEVSASLVERLAPDPAGLRPSSDGSG